MSIDYYAVLGVGRTASDTEIKKSYRVLAMKYHPDQNQGNAEAEIRFKEVTVAYQVLSDPEKRAHYDRFGSYDENSAGSGGFDFSSAFFEDIFGDAFGGMFTNSRRRDANRPARGSNINLNRKISFEESIFGVDLELNVSKHVVCDGCSGSGAAPGGIETCGTCRGSGRYTQRQGLFSIQTSCPACGGLGKIVKQKCNDCSGAGFKEKEKTISVKVPAGIEDSMAIRVSGEGNDGLNGGPAGDIMLAISVKPHQTYKRHGNNLVMELPITFVDAIMGKDIEIPALVNPKSDKKEENIKVNIKAGTQFGDNIVLGRKGAPDVHGRGRGDLVIDLKIMLPTHLNDAQKKVFQNIAEISDEKMYGKNKSLFQKMKDLLS